MVERDVDSSAVLEHRPDGSMVFRLQATNVHAVCAWVLGLGEHAEILGPPEARAEIVQWLEATLAGAPAS